MYFYFLRIVSIAIPSSANVAIRNTSFSCGWLEEINSLIVISSGDPEQSPLFLLRSLILLERRMQFGETILSSLDALFSAAVSISLICWREIYFSRVGNCPSVLKIPIFRRISTQCFFEGNSGLLMTAPLLTRFFFWEKGMTVLFRCLLFLNILNPP